MSKEVDIIIPAKSKQNKIEKTLYSIAYQTYTKNVNVYIVNNILNKKYKNEIDFFSKFMNIQELKIKKELNISELLQLSLNQTNSKYILFLSENGVLASPTVLKHMIEIMEKSKANVVSSLIKKEEEEANQNEIISLYGKLYERNFIEKKGIKFYNCQMNEEVGFNMQIYLNNAKIENIHECTYIELKSLEKTDGTNALEKYYTSIFSYTQNMTYALESAIKNKCDKTQIAYFAFHTLISTYYYYIEIYDELYKKKLLNVSKNIYEIYNKYPVSNEELNEIWYNEFFLLGKNVNAKQRLNPYISFDNFLKLYTNI